MTKREKEYLNNLKLKVNKLSYQKAVDLLDDIIFDTDDLSSADYVKELYRIQEELIKKANV